MRNRLQPWQLAAGAVVLLALVGAVFAVREYEHAFDSTGLIAALPADRATLLYLDAGGLRKAGILDLVAGSRAVEEADYRKFVEQTGFDYRTDLDALAASFSPGSAYFTVRGHFQWKLLAAYASAQGGACHGSICAMPGSSPQRNISFRLLRSNVLALAVSPDPDSVTRIRAAQNADVTAAIIDPVWMAVPPPVFESPDVFPEGTRSFLSPLAHAKQVHFSAGPNGSHIALRMTVTCASPEAAAELSRRLSDTTSLLQKMLTREHMTPNPRDLSGLLVAGTFEQQQSQVIGIWPIERSFLEGLASGQVQ